MSKANLWSSNETVRESKFSQGAKNRWDDDMADADGVGPDQDVYHRAGPEVVYCCIDQDQSLVDDEDGARTRVGTLREDVQ